MAEKELRRLALNCCTSSKCRAEMFEIAHGGYVDSDDALELRRERDEAVADLHLARSLSHQRALRLRAVRAVVGAVDEEGGVYDSPGDLAAAVLEAINREAEEK